MCIKPLHEQGLFGSVMLYAGYRNCSMMVESAAMGSVVFSQKSEALSMVWCGT